ncbi:unnamed protein product [Cuscuta europaea]|uniref:Uncharacterized protein n=1 Tax=Cuscuta europaea TaxID=41803 RepID=A0A9P0YP76_CUSEU|nr:unnamed protein product [Cuscuta europaea]
MAINGRNLALAHPTRGSSDRRRWGGGGEQASSDDRQLLMEGGAASDTAGGHISGFVGDDGYHLESSRHAMAASNLQLMMTTMDGEGGFWLRSAKSQYFWIQNRFLADFLYFG